jgi:hypothetical protein
MAVHKSGQAEDARDGADTGRRVVERADVHAFLPPRQIHGPPQSTISGSTCASISAIDLCAQDAATRSIAALNRISMDFRFVIKTMMAEHPLRVLVVVTITYWICMSWMYTQCER